jgi:hypothetical protein
MVRGLTCNPLRGAEARPMRPLCALDEVARRVYVFSAFADGRGTPFIASDVSSDSNHQAGTKQSVDASTGIMVASGSERCRHGTIGVP